MRLTCQGLAMGISLYFPFQELYYGLIFTLILFSRPQRQPKLQGKVFFHKFGQVFWRKHQQYKIFKLCIDDEQGYSHLRNLNFSFPVTALYIIVFSMFLLIVFVILSLLVTIFFFCSVSGAERGAGSKVYTMITIFAEFCLAVRLSVLFNMLYFVLFFLILHPQNNIYKTIRQQIKQLCMDKKKLSPKQIFRTLAFHYHYDEKIPLDLLCQMVSSMYYPKDPNGQTRKRYKQLLIMLMKQYTQGQKYITQQQFCNYMLQMSKQKKDQYSQKLTHRIFHRYAEIDPDSKQKVICQGGFKQIAQFLKIRSDQAGEYFKSITDRKNQIDFEKFNGFMNSMIINN